MYKSGDYNVICDRTGFKVKASQTRKQWNGLRVLNSVWEPRHPQDFVTSKTDNMSVQDARSDSEPIFVDTNEVKAEDL